MFQQQLLRGAPSLEEYKYVRRETRDLIFNIWHWSKSVRRTLPIHSFDFLIRTVSADEEDEEKLTQLTFEEKNSIQSHSGSVRIF